MNMFKQLKAGLVLAFVLLVLAVSAVVIPTSSIAYLAKSVHTDVAVGTSTYTVSFAGGMQTTDDVEVWVNGVENTAASVVWLTGSTLQLVGYSPAEGDDIEFRRVSPKTDNLVDLEAGKTIRASSLMKNFRHVLQVGQEAYDASTSVITLADESAAAAIAAAADAAASAAIIDPENHLYRVSNFFNLGLTSADNYTMVYLEGYSAKGDGGEGIWIWNPASTAAEDGGTIRAVSGVITGRWVRQLPGPYVTPEMFGAKGDEKTIDNTAFDAALLYWANQPGLGKIVLGPKKYKITALRVGVNNQRIIIEGTSTKVESKAAATSQDIGSVLVIDDSVSTVGVRLEAASCGLKNLTIYGETGNTADGVQLLGNSNFLDTVTVTNMGDDGIVINHPTLYLGYKVNSNNWLLNNVNCRENLGNGVVIDSYHLSVGGGAIGPDANGGTAMHLNCQLNGLNGLVVGHCSVNNFYGLKTESNGNYGVYLAGKEWSQLANVAPTSFSGNNTFHNVHSEGNHSAAVGYQFYCGQYSASNLIYGSPVYAVYDDGQNIVNTIYGSATSKNVYYGTDNFSINAIDAGQNTDTIPYAGSNPHLIMKGTAPGITLKQTDGAADGKTWALRANGTELNLRTVSDTGVAGDYVFEVTRSGNTVVKTVFPDGKVIATDGIGVGNYIAASAVNTLVYIAPLTNAAGTIIGYIPVYSGYTP